MKIHSLTDIRVLPTPVLPDVSRLSGGKHIV